MRSEKFLNPTEYSYTAQSLYEKIDYPSEIPNLRFSRILKEFQLICSSLSSE